MKKMYISPMTENIVIEVQSHLLNLSATGTNMSSEGFSSPIEMGEQTENADSRRGGWFDDED